jgi:hypothetical protein
MSFKSIVEMFKYDSSEQPFVEEAMRLAKAEELMSEIEARTESLQERLSKHGNHDQEDHGGKQKRPRPMPTTPAKPKPEMQIPERPNADKPKRPKNPDDEQALDRLKQEMEEKKKREEAARRKLEEQQGQVRRKGK